MLKVPEHQVAGHFAGAGCLGPLIDGKGLFYKPLQSDDRGSSEVSFYTSFSSDPRVPSHIRRFFPSFHGTQLLALPSGPHHPHLILEDLTAPFSLPSVIDLKIGARTWSHSDPQPYVDKCLSKDRASTSLSLGFRISGLQIYRSAAADLWKPTRGEVKKLRLDDVRRILREFVSAEGADCAMASEVYGGSDGVLAQLMELKAWFEDQTSYHFYSGSVLVMRESAEGEEGRKARVKLVDFAHVIDGEGVIDHNFLGGLCSLIKFVSGVLTNVDGGVMKKKEERGLENGEQHAVP